MKSISIYTITRNQNIECLQKLERQLSGRTYFLKIREWELDSMKALVRQLEMRLPDVYALRFFYSFQIPRLGKEFDLLQIKDDQIVNVELKSGIVSDEAVRKQLLQNRYYLSVQGKTIQSYTYISSQNRLVRLSNRPTCLSTSSPPLRKTMVGMLRTPYFIVISSFSSTSHLPISTRPSYSAASSSTMGAIVRHGPHHSAQKSMTTGSSDEITS